MSNEYLVDVVLREKSGKSPIFKDCIIKFENDSIHIFQKDRPEESLTFHFKQFMNKGLEANGNQLEIDFHPRTEQEYITLSISFTRKYKKFIQSTVENFNNMLNEWNETSRDEIGEPIRTNETLVLNCMKYEYLEGKELEEAYCSLRKTLGGNAIKYKDFDLWWSRFENGNFNLNYDISQDSSTRELMDMPSDVMDIIIGKLGNDDRWSLLCSSKACQTAVERLSYFKSVQVQVKESVQ